jgi:hypothetical protein
MLRWFPNLFGFEESQLAGGEEIQPSWANFLKTQENFKVVNETQLQSLPNGRMFTMGVFSTPTLHELRLSASTLCTEFAQSTENRSAKETHDKKQNHEIISYEHLAITDILKMHNENPGATFQAASQFNCLEFGSPHVTPEYGVTSYAYDETQGPACALACAAGTVFRNYFAHVSSTCENTLDQDQKEEEEEEVVVEDDGLESRREGEQEQEQQRGQSESSQLNNLDELELLLNNKQHKYWTIRNGYSFSDEASLTRLNEVLRREWPQDGPRRDVLRGAVKVGVQEGVGVTFARRFTPFAPEVRL